MLQPDRTAIRIHPRPAVERDGWLRQSALVEGLPGGNTELCFDCEPRHAGLLTSRADPWPLALLFAAMQGGSVLTVDGEVSRELLTNLEAFQETWRLWIHDRYRPVRVAATSEVGGTTRSAGDAGPAVMAFGGGLDGCYTAWRHARRMVGRQTLTLRAGLVVLGLARSVTGGSDSAAVETARALLADLGIDVWTIRTNAPCFAPAWEHAYGAVLASCLHWFSGGVPVGLLAGTGTLAHLNARCGSHPLTDPLLSSDRMWIVHDGAERDVVRKAEVVAAWPEAARLLRGGAGARRILASLALSIAGAQSANPLPGEPTAEDVRSLALEGDQLVRNAKAVLDAADKRGLQRAPWCEPLRQSLARAESAADRPVPRATSPPGPRFRWAPRTPASEIRVFPEPPVPVDGRVVLGAHIEGLGTQPQRLWFSVEARHAPYLSSLADPFACALQLPAMRSGAALVIHGPVSHALLRNLEQFQQIWHTWAPSEVTPISMRADQEVESAPQSDNTLMLFSAGADSSFSVYRHHRGLVGRRSRRISAGLMVLGFDIPHFEVDEFRAAFENSRRMLESLGIDLWSMATNFRDVVGDWEPGHGTAIAACAHCFAGHFATALVASTSTAASLDSPWGSHVLTDRLLSSDRVRVVTDGEDVGKLDKVILLAEWPEAMRRLRVCWMSERRDRNCGECPKCVLTSLLFLANGLPLPSTLRRPAPERVRRLPLHAAWEVRTIHGLLERASAVRVADQPWFLALPECLRWNEQRWANPPAEEPPRRPLWPRVRRRLARELRRWTG
jgi:hypothetical protein